MFGMDLSEKKDGMIREIIREGALKGEWLPMHEAFHSGDAMGFDVAGVAVLATVTFDRDGFVVNMTSPIECTGRKDIYYRQQTFFRRNRPGVSLFEGGVEGGPATQQCVDGAREVLIGLYTDWMILRSRREEIRRKLAGFTEWAASFNRQEMERVAPDRQKLQELEAQSGRLKQRFKDGEMTQAEYIRARQPIHDEIVILIGAALVRDPFRARFEDELSECRFVEDKKSLIENI